MIFNDYNEQGYRRNVVGCRSSIIEDNAILDNLRSRWRNELANMSDQAIVNCYDEFAMSDMFGDNDTRFLEFLKNWDPL